MSNVGSGYFQPTVAITDATGSGAIGTPVISALNQTTQNQEVYGFSAVPLGNVAGVSAILAVKSIAILYDNYRYTLPTYSFTAYQSYIRRYPFQYSYVPTVAGTYGQGTNGSVYLYPIASQAYQMEWDCLCLPSDLLTDTDVDLIPLPWSDSVPYYSAYLALLQMQRPNDARGMLDLFDKMLLRQSVSARPGKPSNPYGRW